MLWEKRWDPLPSLPLLPGGHFRVSAGKSSNARGPSVGTAPVTLGSSGRSWRRQPQAKGGGSGLSSRFIHSLPPSQLELIHKQTT